MRFLTAVLIRPLASSLLLLCLFAAWALLIGRHHAAVFDERVADAVQGIASHPLTAVMKGFTTAGSGPWVAGIMLVIAAALLLLGYRRELIFFAGVIVGSSLLNLLLKLVFRRARPDVHRIIDAAGYSFPSGHSMAAFTLYGITVYFLWKHLARFWMKAAAVSAGIAMILMIGISRIYLGVHYPSDVLGGYLISAAWLTASIGWYERYLKERWSSRKRRSAGRG
ncbi:MULTISPECIES: phosphatase PAP2 family protein [unclassified Paenibacillus]|uniref:phosphatase PAP2 family protein n=1 Tax=unclassified Paenibacillus TaxID=185978 RepID=UPI000954019D|nr:MULTISPECIES: phosphatase PAP2 family protein [unclassified Paenibacillus]ASS65842.2 phosphatase PAP2 family protein [Paenibacillus sp. RUD330]SIQ21777.1 undecaprenyl-diphosphatase [Paenibacillus sp. RU4X]SIQ43522.1 undecaprenyl-diphosphatase [Paenibacillus sp. RU4T]